MDNQEEKIMNAGETITSGANQKSNSDKQDNIDASAVYLADSHLQTKEEFEQSKRIDHTEEDNKFSASDTSNASSESERAAGTDRAGTAERKTFGDTELNKGLESQAKDEES